MNKHQLYYVKQRLIGLATLIGTAVLILFAEDDTFALITVPIGWVLLTTKDMMIYDDYYFELQEKLYEKYSKEYSNENEEL